MEKIHEVINILEATKTAFKSKKVEAARGILVDLLDDPAYDPGEIEAITEIIGREMTGRFTLPEVHALCDNLNSTYMGGGQAGLYMRTGNAIAHNVHDGCALDGLDKTWEIDGPALVAKLEALTDTQAWWLTHQVKSWWHSEEARVNNDATRKLFRVAAEKK